MYIECNTKYIKPTFILTVKVFTVKGNRFDSHVGNACERAFTIQSSCIQRAALRKP